MVYIEQGTKAYRKASLSLFLGGFVTFSTLYLTQPLIPLFVEQFDVTPSTASLALSLSTGFLSFSMIGAGILSDKFGKKKIMSISMFAISLLGILTAFSPNFLTLLVFRALIGIFIAGVPAIAMAYVSEEFNPTGIGKAMGLYISGNSIGGMSGRIVTGFLVDMVNWQFALVFVGVIALFGSIAFLMMLPEPSNSIKNKWNYRDIRNSYFFHFSNKPLLAIVILGFLLMGSFVILYNYIGFLLVNPPYSLSQAVIGFLFIIFLTGTFSAVYLGKKADLYGNALVLKWSVGCMITGALMTYLQPLFFIILGMAIFTFGFFGAHSIASAWVVDYVQRNKTQASSLYLFTYYLGASLMGPLGGWFWVHFEWLGVIVLICGLLALTFPFIRFAEIRTSSSLHVIEKNKPRAT